MRRTRVAVTLALLAGMVGAAAVDVTAVGFETYEQPKPAPDFALPDLRGRMQALSEYRGKVVLLFFWATW
jgi:cytochrome oxidase Cu insertion factor (SCO1/SenC/PrrC family)